MDTCHQIHIYWKFLGIFVPFLYKKCVEMVIKSVIRIIIKFYLNLILISKIFLTVFNDFCVFLYKKLNKKSLLSSAKLFCFLMIIYHGSLLTKQYLDYEYDYKYDIKQNIGYYLPPISFCTKSNVLFNRISIKTFFDLSKQFESYNKYIHYELMKQHSACIKKWNDFDKSSVTSWVNPVIHEYFQILI